MGKGGSSEVKETSAEKENAQIAKENWDLYSNELRPYENLFMDKVDDLNNTDKYDNLAAGTNVSYQQQFGQVKQGTADNLAASGVDPSSGKFQSAMQDITGNQVAGLIDTTNRAQTSQQDKYVAGLQDVASMGSGQKADALSGFSNIAANAQNKALQDAQAAQASQQATAGLVGAGLGAATRWGAGNAMNGTSQPSSASNGVFGASGNDAGGLGLSTSYKDY
ncbi:hypothetical protein PMPD1_2453 [Paramixta manurensis]|uniref:Uncharacterized protein n=1 Tax=Paramixta manurensis TaxID=2740817 RepID=A0A6M8U9M6_9GAMM|nr:hypothetical protein PMPD1_2453 [Erwiniaceae bacterium PD-1]